MRDTIALTLVCSALAAGCAGGAPTDAVDQIPRALTQQFVSPWDASTPVSVFIGTYRAAQPWRPWLVYVNGLTGACDWHLLADADTLTSDVSAKLSKAADLAYVVPNAPFQEAHVQCLTAQTAFEYVLYVADQTDASGDLHSITVDADAGDDLMVCGGSERVYCWGGPGNDSLHGVGNDRVVLGGQAGDDYLETDSWGSDTFLIGGDDNDCLRIPVTAPEPGSNYSCGFGDHDRSERVEGLGCETVVASCS
jgi:hypothetical protein